ncbi:MAG: exo-alpha-sialidase [Clostridiales bacterium]|nr:exo-alpha-sialidase [Clostridiales bacterium]
MDYIDIQTRNHGNYSVYRIPGIVTTNLGAIIVTYECRLTTHDWDSRAISVQRSIDGGNSWSEPYIVVKTDDVLVNNPVLLSCRDGRVILFYSYDYASLHMKISHDDGISFGKEIDISAALEDIREQFDFNVCAAGPGHGIEMSDGTLVLPIWLANGAEYEYNGIPIRRHMPSVCTIITSRDGGDTFYAGEVIHDDNIVKNANETTVAELSDGSLMLNIRSIIPQKRRVSVVSRDNGKSFSKPVLEESLICPICYGSILSIQKNLLAFCNCADIEERKNLTVKFSRDDGKTWDEGIHIYDKAGYSDIAVSQNGRYLYIFFERDNLSALTFTQLEL